VEISEKKTQDTKWDKVEYTIHKKSHHCKLQVGGMAYNANQNREVLFIMKLM